MYYMYNLCHLLSIDRNFLGTHPVWNFLQDCYIQRPINLKVKSINTCLIKFVCLLCRRCYIKASQTFSVLNVLKHNNTWYYGHNEEDSDSTHIRFGIGVGLNNVGESWKAFCRKGYWDCIFRDLEKLHR